MAKTRSMTRNQIHDASSSLSSSSSSSSSRKKRLKTFDKGDVAPWSDLTHNVLFLVMMQLGVVDFLAFGGVCKSWRSLALSNKDIFMASKPPMSIYTGDSDSDDSDSEDEYDQKDDSCYLEDYEKRRFRTIIPHSVDRTCFGITCGYLILFGLETHDFWLVNPITRHELHFPHFRLNVDARKVRFRAILVFSPSISGWVLVVLCRKLSQSNEVKISFSITGKRGWNHVSSILPTARILDLQAFKGKIYILHDDFSVRELRLYTNRKRKWELLETNNFPKPDLSYPELVSSCENLYAVSRHTRTMKVMELDLGEMKWVSPEKIIGEYAFFVSWEKSSAAIKPESWAGHRTQYKSYDYFPDNRQCMSYPCKGIWYFPHDCLNANILDE